VIDLHLHTTASDGALSPEALVRKCAAAGVTTMAVTDHDTVGGVAAATAAARAVGIDCLPGIEITALLAGRDVHILGYGFDPADAALAAFLVRQRDDRRRRVIAMAEKLTSLGVPIDTGALLNGHAAISQRALGRPALAAALVSAGHARDIADAFDRFLGFGRPAFVERSGSPPRDVFALVRGAGGVSSIAHPVKIGDDAVVRRFIGDGLDAIEVHHPDHDTEATARYRAMADDAGLLVTGGSDYHGDDSGRVMALGRIGLPQSDFDRLVARAPGAVRRG
jgi:predicted metal-dependent phosphoesterase TrpH